MRGAAKGPALAVLASPVWPDHWALSMGQAQEGDAARTLTPSCLGTFPSSPCASVPRGHCHHCPSRTGEARRGKGVLPLLGGEAGSEPGGRNPDLGRLTPGPSCEDCHMERPVLSKARELEMCPAESGSRELRASAEEEAPTAGFHATSGRSCPVCPHSNPLRGTWKLRSANPQLLQFLLTCSLRSPRLKPSGARIISVHAASCGGLGRFTPSCSHSCMLLCPEPQDWPADRVPGAQEAGESVRLEAVSERERGAHTASHLQRTAAAGLGVSRPQAPGAPSRSGGTAPRAGPRPSTGPEEWGWGHLWSSVPPPACLSSLQAAGPRDTLRPLPQLTPSTYLAWPAHTSYSWGSPQRCSAECRTHLNLRETMNSFSA